MAYQMRNEYKNQVRLVHHSSIVSSYIFKAYLFICIEILIFFLLSLIVGMSDKGQRA